MFLAFLAISFFFLTVQLKLVRITLKWPEILRTYQKQDKVKRRQGKKFWCIFLSAKRADSGWISANNATRSYFGGKSHSHGRHVNQRQLKSRIKTKPESGNCFCIRVVWSIKLRLIVMSTNLEYRARERQRKRESRRQANEAQREKGRQRSRVGDQKQRRHSFVGITTRKFCCSGDKMRNASGTNARWKWAAVKKSEREHVRHFLHKTCK